MFNTCFKCGEYGGNKEIDKKGMYAICPFCGYKQTFKQLPLFVVTGASGAGKSTVCTELMTKYNDVAVIEADVFWRQEFSKSVDDFRNLCLRVAKNVAQAGKPVLLCGSSLPQQYEECEERRYFSEIYYSAIVCDENKMTQRLKNRPANRESGSDDFISSHIKFNNWFVENSNNLDMPIKIFDNSNESISDTTEKLSIWIKEILKNRKK